MNPEKLILAHACSVMVGAIGLFVGIRGCIKDNALGAVIGAMTIAFGAWLWESAK